MAESAGTGVGVRAGGRGLGPGAGGTRTVPARTSAPARGFSRSPARSAPARRRQRERSDATVEDLLAAARALFAADGYAATSLDAVCERAGVTKGALYHHFSGKQQLFSAVYTREQQRLSDTVSAAYLVVAEDPWEAVYAGSRAYLEAAIDPEVQRITFIDAPGALGWEVMRDLGTNCRELALCGVSRAIRAGAIPLRPAGPLTSILYGGLSEGAMAVIRADDPRAALRETLTELRRLFDTIAAEAED